MSEPDRRFDSWQKEVPYAIARPRRRGLLIVLALTVLFGGWAMLAPLDGAVVATGSFIANGQNKEVQHLEGGIVRELLVREGDLVEREAEDLAVVQVLENGKLLREVRGQAAALAAPATTSPAPRSTCTGTSCR